MFSSSSESIATSWSAESYDIIGMAITSSSDEGREPIFIELLLIGFAPYIFILTDFYK